MIAILVATPFQLFNSMVIMNHYFKDEKCDIFALDLTCDMHVWLDNMKSNSFINKVYYMHDVWNHKSKIGVFGDHVHLTKEQKEMLRCIKGNRYSILLSTWVGMNSTWLFTKLKKNNPNLKVYFYEEGIGVYVDYIYKKYNGIRWMYKLLGYSFEENFVEKLYMYRPEICTHVNGAIKRERIGIPSKDDMNNFFDVWPKIYDYPGKIIFFDCNLDASGYPGLNEVVMLNKLLPGFDHSKISVRIHPRKPSTSSCEYLDNGYFEDMNYGIPWELLLNFDKIDDDKIFVTSISSAVFTPKMIFDKEPRVLILALAIKNEFKGCKMAAELWTPNIQTMFEAVYGLYLDKERIKLPKSFKEATEILKKWTNER